MWPFRKRAQDTPGDAPPSSDAGSIQRVSEGGARSSATVVRPTPVEPGWSSLAPLATCVQPMRTTIDTDAFTASLASHSPPTFLSPLSHAVAADAPSGEVNGLASVTTRRATVADPRPLDLPVVARSDASVTGSLQRFANPFGSPIAVASPAPVPVPAATVAPSGADSQGSVAGSPDSSAGTTESPSGGAEVSRPLVGGVAAAAGAPPAASEPAPPLVEGPAVQRVALAPPSPFGASAAGPNPSAAVLPVVEAPLAPASAAAPAPVVGPARADPSAGPTRADPSTGPTRADPSTGPTRAEPSAGPARADPSTGPTRAVSDPGHPREDVSLPFVQRHSDGGVNQVADPSGEEPAAQALADPAASFVQRLAEPAPSVTAPEQAASPPEPSAPARADAPLLGAAPAPTDTPAAASAVVSAEDASPLPPSPVASLPPLARPVGLGPVASQVPAAVQRLLTQRDRGVPAIEPAGSASAPLSPESPSVQRRIGLDPPVSTVRVPSLLNPPTPAPTPAPMPAMAPPAAPVPPSPLAADATQTPAGSVPPTAPPVVQRAFSDAAGEPSPLVAPAEEPDRPLLGANDAAGASEAPADTALSVTGGPASPFSFTVPGSGVSGDVNVPAVVAVPAHGANSPIVQRSAEPASSPPFDAPSHPPVPPSPAQSADRPVGSAPWPLHVSRQAVGAATWGPAPEAPSGGRSATSSGTSPPAPMSSSFTLPAAVASFDSKGATTSEGAIVGADAGGRAEFPWAGPEHAEPLPELQRQLTALPGFSAYPPPPGGSAAERSNAGPGPVAIPARQSSPPVGENLAAALAGGVVQRQADGSFVFSPPQGDPAFEASAAVQREPAQGGTDDGASVQFEAVARAAVAGAGQPGGAPAGSGGAAGAMSGADLDELSRRLYSRLRIQLQQELRLDRERVGQIMNRR